LWHKMKRDLNSKGAFCVKKVAGGKFFSKMVRSPVPKPKAWVGKQGGLHRKTHLSFSAKRKTAYLLANAVVKRFFYFRYVPKGNKKYLKIHF